MTMKKKFFIGVAIIVLLFCVVVKTTYADSILTRIDTLEYDGKIHTYRVYSDNMVNWYNAKDLVSSNLGDYGYHLVTITDQFEQDFINKSILDGIIGDYWIGGYQDFYEQDTSTEERKAH